VFSKVNVWVAPLFGATWPVTNRRAWRCPAWPGTIDLTGIGFGNAAVAALGPHRQIGSGRAAGVAAQGLASLLAAMLVRLRVIVRLPVIHFLVG